MKKQNEAVEFDDTNLKIFHKILIANNARLKIGIIGRNAKRSGKGPSNALIGARHEFGAEGLPIRSFLMMPLTTKFFKKAETLKLVGDDFIAAMKDKNLKKFLQKVGVMCMATILEAFDTGGWGKWPKLQLSTMQKKKVKQILVETHRLRDAVTYEVEVSA